MTKFDSHNINAAHTQRELEQANTDMVMPSALRYVDTYTSANAASARQARINAAIEEDAHLFCERTKQWMERG